MKKSMRDTSGTLLLTGATGFLGGAIAAALLSRRPGRRILLLVRAKNAGEGRERLAATLERHGVPSALRETLSPDDVLCGDLDDPRAFAADPRLRGVSDVVNCAAFASFSNHPGIFRTNVEGTLAFATMLSTATRLRRFIQVGAAMCCGEGAPRIVAEDFRPPAGATHLVPYTASKLEAERRLRAELPGLPVVFARPNIIVGHTRLGCRPSPSIYWVFRMARALRRFPCPPDAVIDVIPVDYCAEALLHLLERPRLARDTYHVSSGTGRSCSFRQIDAAIAQALGEPALDDYRQASWESIAREQHRFDELFGACVKPIMLRAIRIYGAFASMDTVFDNSLLLAEGVPPPPRFTDYAGVCALSAAGEPIARQMLYDFKGLARLERPARHAA